MTQASSGEMPAPPRIPRATYRIQFNRTFTFADAERIVPYLAELGISDLYASPYLRARPGSMHGYDILDHAELNPEIGTEAEHAALCGALRVHGMGQILDVVPNHMGVGVGNPWWRDVLEHGPSSPYAPYFDIDWRPLQPELAGKVLLPILGDAYGRVLERGELRLEYEGVRFAVRYFEHTLPASPRSIGAVLRDALERLSSPADDADRMELESIHASIAALPERARTDPESGARRRREWTVAQRRIAALYESSPAVREALDGALEALNGTPGESASFDALHELLEEQAYRLAFWRVAAEEINYRRFFDINDLAGVRVERPEVFEATHRLVARFVAEGKATGLRIDHPDGLYDPRAYLRRLREAMHHVAPRAPAAYLLVEKILTGDESLPEDWPVEGTVGYEFTSRLGALFVARGNQARMDTLYRRFTHLRPSYADLVYEKKRLIVRTSLVSELSVLATLLSRISEDDRCSRDFTLGALRDALRETIACFPVYRTYIDAHAGAVSASDRRYVEQAIRIARRRNPATSDAVFDFIRRTLLLEWPAYLDEPARAKHARFVMKFQQLTGPVMAKGAEDTTFYVFNRLVSLNEVGGEPGHFGVTPEEMHAWLAGRAARWPHTMNATSTHDTKRSEDVRARIDVLSEMPDEWEAALRRWAALNAPLKPVSEDEEPIPDLNDEYLLYQTLLGAWPLDPMDDARRAEFAERIGRYMEKATREAKAHTSWINPNAEYDAGLQRFVAGVLDPARSAEFLRDFGELREITARLGMLNSLAQTTVKLAAPGVPDIYQGQEMWDFSLVDPDNRRPVDYAARSAALDSVRSGFKADPAAFAAELLRGWEDGRIKLLVTWCGLELRRAREALFASGGYLALESAGPRAEHLFAFARGDARAEMVAVVPRLVGTLTREQAFAPPTAALWAGTAVEAPADVLGGRYRNVFTGEAIVAHVENGRARLAAEEVFATLPVALLERVG